MKGDTEGHGMGLQVLVIVGRHLKSISSPLFRYGWQVYYCKGIEAQGTLQFWS